MIDFLYSQNFITFLLIMVKIIALVVPLLVIVAFLTYAERKVIASVQLRKGPNVVGPFGLLQPLADGLKLFSKETIFPTVSNKIVFILAPMIAFSLSIAAWAVIPIADGWVISNINVGILYLFAVSSLSVYGIIMAGWASNSKYAFMGALRSAAQMVSYEVSIGLVIVTVLLCVGSLNLTAIVYAQKSTWFVFPLFPMFIVFFISALAETNRAPFDLPEDESSLVGGYFTEYSSMIMMSGMATILFLGGWLAPFDIGILNYIPGFVWFSLKTSLILFIFLWVRATFPRFRYDQLMRIGWKVFLPFSLLWVVLTSGFLIIFNLLPVSS
jgi:NADH-quinone oxidoreductase subunit H